VISVLGLFMMRIVDLREVSRILHRNTYPLHRESSQAWQLEMTSTSYVCYD
jgi:hypothetical protein